MDPLSLVASIAGLLTITAQITTIVTNFTSRVIDAPAFSRVILDNISSTRAIIVQLKELFDSDYEVSEICRVAMAETLAGCVVQFDVLRKHLDGLAGTADRQERVGKMDRLR